MRIPNRELEVVLPAVAKEARDYPSPAADAALERLMRFALERELHGTIRTVRAILETEAAPTRDAAQPSDAREV